MVSWPTPLLSGLLVIGAVALCVATVVEWHGVLSRIVLSSAMKTPVKLAMGFIGAVVAFASTVFAKHLVHAVVEVDPASFPEFVRLAAAALFPLAFALTLALSVGALMMLQYMFMVVFLLASWVASSAMAPIPAAARRSISTTTYRILHGRRPEAAIAWWQFMVEGVHHLMRPIGTTVVLVLVVGAAKGMVYGMSAVPTRYVQHALVHVEYRWPHRCENVPAAVRVAYLSGGYVSTADERVGGGYVFGLARCHKAVAGDSGAN
jgi:hypothetical protein